MVTKLHVNGKLRLGKLNTMWTDFQSGPIKRVYLIISFCYSIHSQQMCIEPNSHFEYIYIYRAYTREQTSLSPLDLDCGYDYRHERHRNNGIRSPVHQRPYMHEEVTAGRCNCKVDRSDLTTKTSHQ